MLKIPTEHPLWVVKYSEPHENNLSIILIEAKTSTDPIETEFGPGHLVRPERSSLAFSVTWRDYVAFAVRNESFAVPEGDTPVGYGLGTKKNSLFEAYVTESTYADNSFPGPLTHWYLNTERHCFDVISTHEPEVRQLSSEETKSVFARYV